MGDGYEDEEIRRYLDRLFTRHHLRIMGLEDHYPDQSSIEFTWDEIAEEKMGVANCICENPDRCLSIGEDVLKEHMADGTINEKHPLRIRVKGLPSDKMFRIGEIDSDCLGKLVAAQGILVRLSDM